MRTRRYATSCLKSIQHHEVMFREDFDVPVDRSSAPIDYLFTLGKRCNHIPAYIQTVKQISDELRYFSRFLSNIKYYFCNCWYDSELSDPHIKKSD